MGVKSYHFRVKINQKIAQEGEDLDFYSEMVRVGRIELPSQVWKTCILTAVLHPQAFTIVAERCYNVNTP